MPNLDKTGPTGQGPMTGRKLGNCQTCEGQHKGMARCRGCGLGIGRFWSSSENDITDLKAIEAQLSVDLDDLRKEIAKVENQANK
ncbi:hypothetical protein CVV43_03275 [Candidatus Saccharibacteria bacterium HGW-Saccharibacteria-1]|jgi:hypothetical protein|nr:MAG: hypothetical protein CVV43_03275 [Candidatus Saccharibacteria bacterium HGW-Saccharibacteria-1]